MSVLVSNRKESKFEAVTYSIELHAMLTELMQRSFGVKIWIICTYALCVWKR